MTYSIDKGFELGNQGKNIKIRKGDFKLKFDRIINTKSGYVCGVITKRKKNCAVANSTLEKSSSVDVNYFHELLGHFGEEQTRVIAIYYGVKLSGKFNSCSDCAKAKAKQANVPKGIPDEKRSKLPGERFFLLISSIKTRSFGGSKFWLLLVDDANGFKFSYFLKRKSETAGKVIALIKHLKATLNYQIKYICCDNAGENRTLEEKSKNEGLGIIYEYTAPNTPQPNGRVERAFATLYGRVRSMLNSACLNKEFRQGLWAECATTACVLDNLDCSGNKKPHKAFKYLRKFGKIGIVTKKDKIKGKLTNRGEECIYLGHAKNHSGEVVLF